MVVGTVVGVASSSSGAYRFRRSIFPLSVFEEVTRMAEARHTSGVTRRMGRLPLPSF
jgi:hypothetical protein